MRSPSALLLIVSLGGCSTGLAHNQVSTVLPHGAIGQRAVNSWPKVPRPDPTETVRNGDDLVILAPNQADPSQGQPPASLPQWVNGAAQVRIQVRGRWVVVTRPSLDSFGIIQGTVRRIVGPKRLWGIVELPVDEYLENGIALHLMDIDVLQLPAGTWAAEGALIGVTAGASLGFAAGALLSEMDFSNDGMQWDVAMGAAMFYGVVGGAVGAMKGNELKKWTTVYLRTPN